MKIGNYKKSAAMAMLLTTAGLFGAVNQIELSAYIDSKAVVGFSDVSSSTASGPVFVDDTLNSINFGSESAGNTHGAITRQLFVLTNNPAGVNMSISDSVNNGNLKHSSQSDEIGMNYSFAGSPIALGIPFNVATGTNAGSTPVGDMVFTPSATTSGMAAGSYSTTLTVTIAAN